jgi:Domain of unknown function (DUF4351)
MSTPRTDQDSPWKMILRHYFQDAITFFFPDTARLIDWRKPIEFLDKELLQITVDAEIGKRHADQLVKVGLKRGQDLILLVHVEVQAKPEANFPERMLVYNLRIFNLFRQPTVSLAILCDGNPRWRPNRYTFAFPNTKLDFEFGIVKLLDYRERWDELEQSQNPFAIVVMAQLKMLEAKKDSKRRKESKLWLIRRLYEAGHSRQDVLNLFQFIDWLIMLPEGLHQAFWTELKVYEEERRMPYITSVERMGFARGLEQGLEQAVERERSLVLRLLTQKVGPLSPQLIEPIAALSLPQIEALAIALLNFSTVADLEVWLEHLPE